MPLFNIELRTFDRVWETLSVEMDDIRALPIEMARFVGELLKEHAEQIWSDREWRVDVTDQTGLILYVMHISTTNTAATMPSHRDAR